MNRNKITQIGFLIVTVFALLNKTIYGCLQDTTEADVFTRLKTKAEKFWKQEHLQSLYQMTSDNKILTIAALKKEYQEKIVCHAMGVRTIIPMEAIPLFTHFLKEALENGTDAEKKLYNGMSLAQFVYRLIKKRPLAFTNPEDIFMLQSGYRGQGGFEKIGTDQEEDLTRLDPSFNIENNLTSDEIFLASLVGLRIPTLFINAGQRDNHAQASTNPDYPVEATVLAVVGSRFEKPGYGDCPWMVIEENPTREIRPWFKKLVSIFFGYEFFTFSQAKEYIQAGGERFIPAKTGNSSYYNSYFDKLIYKQRSEYLWRTPIEEQNELWLIRKTKQFMHMPGAGLGGWKFPYFKQTGNWIQESLTLKVISSIINSKPLEAISDLSMCFFNEAQSKSFLTVGNQDYGHNDVIQRTEKEEIKLCFEVSDPAARRKGMQNKALVSFLPWDSNAYIGNEFFLANNIGGNAGYLHSSADPSFACASTISEIGNPKINPFIKENIIKDFEENGKFSPKAIEKAEKEWQLKKKLLYNTPYGTWFLLQKKMKREVVKDEINLSSHMQFTPHQSEIIISNSLPYLLTSFNTTAVYDDGNVVLLRLDTQKTYSIDLGTCDPDLKCDKRNRYRLSALQFSPSGKWLVVVGEKFNLQKASSKKDFIFLIDIKQENPQIINLSTVAGFSEFTSLKINKIAFNKDETRMLTYQRKNSENTLNALIQSKENPIIWWKIDKNSYQMLVLAEYHNTRLVSIAPESNGKDVIVSYSDGCVYKHFVPIDFKNKLSSEKIFINSESKAPLTSLIESVCFNSQGDPLIASTVNNDIIFINHKKTLEENTKSVNDARASNEEKEEKKQKRLEEIRKKDQEERSEDEKRRLLEDEKRISFIDFKETKDNYFTTITGYANQNTGNIEAFFRISQNGKTAQSEIIDTGCSKKNYNCNYPMPIQLEDELGLLAIPFEKKNNTSKVLLYQREEIGNGIKKFPIKLLPAKPGVIKNIKFLKAENGDIKIIVIHDGNAEKCCHLYTLTLTEIKEILAMYQYLAKQQSK